jgi:broad specificity phosphatase PhoE
MQLILVRHGYPDVPTHGHSGNPPLSARGLEQARHAAVALQAEPIDLIVSSGMHRADSTAQPLAEALGMTIETLPDLGEVDRWGGEYASIESIRQQGRAEWQRFLDAPIAYFGIDAERFRQETLAAFESLIGKDDHRTVAVFTHGFPINILLSHALGLAHDARFVPSYGSITRVAGRSFDALTVISVNESGHIPQALK